MAHSGTTIIAYILKQYPDFLLVVNGKQEDVLENDFLPKGDIEGIENINKNEKRIILKRPWIESGRTDWLIENMPNAYYIYCLKEKEKNIKSWSAPNAYVGNEFKKSPYEEKSKKYDECYNDAMKLKANVKKFFILENEKLLDNPKKMFDDINQFLNAEKFDYDLSVVSSTESIKIKINEERERNKNNS
jgi:hypothetical protein